MIPQQYKNIMQMIQRKMLDESLTYRVQVSHKKNPHLFTDIEIQPVADCPCSIQIFQDALADENAEGQLRISCTYPLGAPFHIVEFIPTVMYEDKVHMYRELGFRVLNPCPPLYKLNNNNSCYAVLAVTTCFLFGEKMAHKELGSFAVPNLVSKHLESLHFRPGTLPVK